MKHKHLIPFLVAILCLGFLGCGGPEACSEQEQMVGDLKSHIAALKDDKAQLDKMVDSLNKKIARLNLNIVKLEGTYQDLYEAQETPTFWNSFDWIAQRINIALLGLLVLLILYRALHRQRTRDQDE